VTRRLAIVKLERLLKLPRPVRTIHLVINIPELATAPPVITPPPKPTAWARTWAILKIAGPASVATAAIIISVFSLRQQSTANLDQQLANKAVTGSIVRHDAEQLSFLQDYASRPPFTSLMVENLATTPAYFVSFQVQAVALVSGKADVVRAFTLLLGNIPACSSGAVNFAPTVTAAMEKVPIVKASHVQADTIGIVVNSISFADGDGLDWQSLGMGDLQQLTALPLANPTLSLQATYKAAPGCATAG